MTWAGLDRLATEWLPPAGNRHPYRVRPQISLMHYFNHTLEKLSALLGV